MLLLLEVQGKENRKALYYSHAISTRFISCNLAIAFCLLPIDIRLQWNCHLQFELHKQ
ncbi:MAG: hypothetical protein JWR72_3882 [Flavisolibacter sp.]|nr:hypothetical protein [Flavisolibacter sp.]